MSYRFTEACDGCSACVRQCPVNAIVGHFKERYDVDRARCIDCGVCGEICPIGAVLDEHGRVAQFVPRDQRARPVVDDSRCNGCALCVAACPFECRVVVGPRYQGISVMSSLERCVSCGECAKVCIKGAIRMRPIDPRAWRPDEVRARAATVLREEDRWP